VAAYRAYACRSWCREADEPEKRIKIIHQNPEKRHRGSKKLKNTETLTLKNTIRLKIIKVTLIGLIK
jgi:hypothetical protein